MNIGSSAFVRNLSSFNINVLKPHINEGGIIVYGAGDNCIRFLTSLFLLGIKANILCVVDADKSKQGKSILGLPVVSIESLQKYDKQTPVLITPSKGYEDIANNLKNVQFLNIFYFDKAVNDYFAIVSKYSTKNSQIYNPSRVLLSNTNDKFYVELGAGGFKRDGGAFWVSVDLEGADINMDLTKTSLPFPDKSVDCFYSSHVFEHFSYPEPMLSILKDCLRCLKVQGIFSICVPDAAMYVDAYQKGKYPLLDGHCMEEVHYMPAVHHNSKMDILNYMAYMDGHHKYLFDIEGLLSILSSAGFKNVLQRDFDPCFDLEGRRWGSIYAIANR